MEYHQEDGTGSMSGRIHISSRTTFVVNMVLPRQHTSHWKATSYWMSYMHSEVKTSSPTQPLMGCREI